MPEGYKLWFSKKFQGMFLETMFFTAPGYIFIKRFLLETLLRNPKYVDAIFGRSVADYRQTSLYRRAKALYDVGESLKSMRQCKCGQIAKFFVAEGAEDDGYVFPPNELFCEKCRPEREARRHVLPIKFSIVATFGHHGDQAHCMSHIRWLLGLDKRMTLEKAIAFFEVAMAVEDVPPALPPTPGVAVPHAPRSVSRVAPVVSHAPTSTKLLKREAKQLTLF